jgi:hypothetical protein
VRTLTRADSFRNPVVTGDTGDATLMAAKYAWPWLRPSATALQAAAEKQSARDWLKILILEQTVRYTYKRSHKIIIESHSAPRDGDGGAEGDDAIFGLPKRGFAAISQQTI